jgi:hypothetical protein
MNETPKSPWKKSWKGPRGFFFLWLLILATAFLIIFTFGLSTRIADSNANLTVVSLIWATAVAVTGFLIASFIRWIFCWRNFKRFLFGVACFVTLIALFYAEENWRGKHDWEKFKREWEAKGEKFDFKDFIPPPVPDDQNFALTPIVASSYAALLDKTGHEINPRNTNVVNRLEMLVSYEVIPPVNGIGNWQKSTMTDLKAWQDYYRALAAKTNEFPVAPQPQTPAQDVLLALSKYDSAIKELRAASRRPYSRFPLDYDDENPAEILLPHLAELKHCCLVLQLRAIAELENGQSDKALDDVKLALSLMNSIRTEPFIISQLVRFAGFQITLQPIYEGLAEHKWSGAQLAELESELSKLDFLAGYELSVGGERACHIKVIDYLERKRSRFREIWGMLGGDSDTPWGGVMEKFFVGAGCYLAPKGWFYQNELVLARMDQRWKLSAVDDDQQTISPKEIAQADVAIGSINPPTPFNFFVRLLQPVLGGFAKRTAYAQNAVNLARVAIALERYRIAHSEYPPSLDALVPQFIDKLPHDVIGGQPSQGSGSASQPLHYRRTDDGQFVLYSVGWNETDDRGVVGFNKDGRMDINKGDWVWRYPQK